MLTPYVFFAVARYCVSEVAAASYIAAGMLPAWPPSGVVTVCSIHAGASHAVAMSWIPCCWSCCM